MHVLWPRIGVVFDQGLHLAPVFSRSGVVSFWAGLMFNTWQGAAQACVTHTCNQQGVRPLRGAQVHAVGFFFPHGDAPVRHFERAWHGRTMERQVRTIHRRSWRRLLPIAPLELLTPRVLRQTSGAGPPFMAHTASVALAHAPGAGACGRCASATPAPTPHSCMVTCLNVTPTARVCVRVACLASITCWATASRAFWLHGAPPHALCL